VRPWNKTIISQPHRATCITDPTSAQSSRDARWSPDNHTRDTSLTAIKRVHLRDGLGSTGQFVAVVRIVSPSSSRWGSAKLPLFAVRCTPDAVLFTRTMSFTRKCLLVRSLCWLWFFRKERLIFMKFATNACHLHQFSLLTFQRSRSKIKVKNRGVENLPIITVRPRFWDVVTQFGNPTEVLFAWIMVFRIPIKFKLTAWWGFALSECFLV